MVDTPQQAAARRKARELLQRLEREANSPATLADRAARQARIRKERVDARIDAALAESRSRAARGELTPEQTARRKYLNDKWATKHDGPGHGMSDAEFREMQALDAIAARAPVPVKAAPRPAPPTNGKKQMNDLAKAVKEAIGREIADHRRERELQAQKIETALARLDAVMARAEAAGAKGDRDAPQSRFIVTR